jgi:predicted type IV restriction endonuclease
MAVYQDKAKERIQKGLRRFKNVVKKAAAHKANEADTRVVVNAVLSELLGWDQFEDITGEHRIRGRYADFVIKRDRGIFAVVEVKAISLDLNEKHLYQAVSYAANEGIDWVVLTNGDEWRCYRVLFNKPVDKDLVFKVRITDSEMRPRDKAELLYLLSIEAQRKNELFEYYERQAAMSGSNLAAALLSDRVITSLRTEIRAQTGHRPTKEDLAIALIERVVCPEAQDSDVAKLVRRAGRLK